MTAAPVHTQEETSGGEDRNARGLIAVLFVLLSPVTAITAAGVYVTFVYLKIRRSVILLFTSPLLLTTLILFIPAVNWFVDSWTVTLPAIVSQQIPVFQGILTMLGQQALLGAAAGVLFGLGIATWKWYTRARWQDWKFRKAPWELLKYSRTVREIKHDENTPISGMTLGVDEDGNRVIQTEDEAAAHTLVTGGSNSGKTTTSMMRIRDQIKRGEGVVIIDLKSDPELAALTKEWCDRYGRKFQHFTLQDITKPYEGPAEEGNAHYDPLAQGDHTRRADMILDLREWGTNAEVFKKMTQSYLQLLFTVLINNPRPRISTLEDAIDLMDPKYLQERAKPLAADPRFASFVRSIDALNDVKVTNNVRDNLQTNRSQLEIFLQSIAGPWLRLDTKNNNNISILDAAYQGNVIVFSLDSQAYGSLSANLANLIIQDLKTVSSELLRNPANKPFNVFVDEFSAIGSDNIIGLINKARAARMSVTLATQALGDLMVNNPALKMQIMGIISSFIIHRANTYDDALVYSGLTGTITTNKMTRQSVDYSQSLLGGIGSGIGTGTASVEEKEEWKVQPQVIQQLSQGEMIFISAATHRIIKVKCIKEDLFPTTHPEHRNTLTTTTPPPVNQTLHLDKETLMTEPEPPKEEVTAAQPSEVLRENKKVALNYNLLRTFFNDQEEVEKQMQEDIADGVLVETVTPVRPTPVRPNTPARPQPPAKAPEKTEFDF